MTSGRRDLLGPLLDLPGVADAAEAARTALGKAHRHRANLRNWPVTAAESTVRGARSSSALDGGGVGLQAASGSDDPVLAGALRVGQAMEGGATNLVGAWQRAPLQALARLHALAAADLVSDAHLGRPRQSPEVVARLDLVTRLVTGGSSAPAPVLAAVVHGEVLTLAPFGSADGVVARAVSRLVTIASGLDPHGLGVPEVFWLRREDDYRSAAAGFATGEPDGVGDWILMCCRALEDGAREALSIAEAAADQPRSG
ncbi:MAG: oxidoreductase [Mycobacteriaceae bacterium]